ncbi:MAG: hypothetical protein HY820_04280 [Acidobacteria bacterium]|nr:hypothetical protein [Acidobacteriota bacterium]
MTLTIELPPELEEALQARAQHQGVSASNIAVSLLTDALTSTATRGPAPPEELPLLHLGAMGPLRRRDIYDDAR